jgi:hypothetical protein
MAPRIPSKKLLHLPPAVLEAKAFLEQKNCKSLSVMKKLTESEDAEQQQALIRMWISLDNSIKKQPVEPGHPGNMWPLFFVGYVQRCSDLPPYFYQPKSERKQLILEIKEHIGGLTKVLKKYRFDHHLAYAESRNALYFIERMGFLDNFKAEQSTAEKPTVSELLNRLVDTIEAEFSVIKQTKKDNFEKARPFVCKLAQYLEDVHGKASNVVLLTATNAIRGKEYKPSDIRRILKRNGIGKT